MYAPYGEQLLNQHAGTYDERFKFTGKERDEETGYDYFGARYYLPDYSIFSTVDPLTDKNIESSSYMYCEGNPIKYVDPDGQWVHIVVGAAIGATISGGYALYKGGSWSQVGAAALGGAVAGGITAATAGLAGELSVGAAASIMASAGIGTLGGALGSAAGNITEQGVNMAVGNQNELDIQDIQESAKVGAILGGVGGAISGAVSGVAKKMLEQLPAKYQSSSLRKTIRSEILKEQKLNGKKTSNAQLDRMTNQRLETSQKVDECAIKGAKNIINDGVINTTTNAAENEDIF